MSVQDVIACMDEYIEWATAQGHPVEELRFLVAEPMWESLELALRSSNEFVFKFRMVTAEAKPPYSRYKVAEEIHYYKGIRFNILDEWAWGWNLARFNSGKMIILEKPRVSTSRY